MFRAAWLSVAASVCASAATSISRVCSAGPRATPAATRNEAKMTATGLAEANAKIASEAAIMSRIA